MTTTTKKTRSQKIAEMVFAEIENLENELNIVNEKFGRLRQHNVIIMKENKNLKKFNIRLQDEKSELIDENARLTAENDQLKAEIEKQKSKKTMFGKLALLASAILVVSFLF